MTNMYIGLCQAYPGLIPFAAISQHGFTLCCFSSFAAVYKPVDDRQQWIYRTEKSGCCMAAGSCMAAAWFPDMLGLCSNKSVCKERSE